MRDLPFEWTENINKPLRDNRNATKAFDKNAKAWIDYYLIFHGFEMDFNQFGNVCLMCYQWKSFRTIFWYILFYVVRGVLQENFVLSRPYGFIFYYPGINTFTAPYWDVLDFFYSGHIGNTFIHVWDSWR